MYFIYRIDFGLAHSILYIKTTEFLMFSHSGTRRYNGRYKTHGNNVGQRNRILPRLQDSGKNLIIGRQLRKDTTPVNPTVTHNVVIVLYAAILATILLIGPAICNLLSTVQTSRHSPQFPYIFHKYDFYPNIGIQSVRKQEPDAGFSFF